MHRYFFVLAFVSDLLQACSLNHGPRFEVEADPARAAEYDAGTMPESDGGIDFVDLEVTMASTPSSTVAVAHELNARSLGVVFSARSLNVLVDSVPFAGRGNVGTAFTSSDLNDVITSCALFNGDTQVGLSQTPDPESGTFRIRGMNLEVPSWTSVTLELRCTPDTVVARDDGDRYAIGIADTPDIEATGPDGERLVSSASATLVANTGPEPVNVVTVLRHGEVLVDDCVYRPSTILVADGDAWQSFGQCRVTAYHEDIDHDLARLMTRGESASFAMVGVASDGRVLGSSVLPVGEDLERDVSYASPLRIPRDESRIIQFWAKIAPVVSAASVGGATSGVPRSGNVVQLGLAAGAIIGDWDETYSGHLNLRFRGATSGDRLLAAGPERIGNQFVIRRSRPTFTRLPLPTTTIVNGEEQVLYRDQVSADPAGSISIASRSMFIDISSSTARVCGVRVLRDSVPMDPSTYLIAGMNDLSHCFFRGGIGTGTTQIDIWFTEEEIISGSGSVYTLVGTPSEFVAGDTLTVRPGLPDPVFGTGYLIAPLSAPRIPAVDRSPYGWPDSTSLRLGGNLIWSDLSEVPHSAQYGSDGGSRDWTNGYLIEDLTQSSTLSL